MTEIQFWDALEEQGLTPTQAHEVTRKLLLMVNTVTFNKKVAIEQDGFMMTAIDRPHGGVYFNLSSKASNPLSNAMPKYLIAAKLEFQRDTNCQSPEQVVQHGMKTIADWCDCLNKARAQYSKTDKMLPDKTGRVYDAA